MVILVLGIACFAEVIVLTIGTFIEVANDWLLPTILTIHVFMSNWFLLWFKVEDRE